MTKHRRITGFVAVALLAVAATAATMRSHSPWTDGTTGLTVDANKAADFEDRWSAKTHRNPGGDQPQHELAGVTIMVRQVISKLDAASPVSCHDPHFKGRSSCRKAVPVHRQPMSLGKVEEHSRIATCGNDPPGRGIGLEPVLFKILLPCHTSHAILSV